MTSVYDEPDDFHMGPGWSEEEQAEWMIDGIATREVCPRCKGSGVAGWYATGGAIRCGDCRGTGWDESSS